MRKVLLIMCCLTLITGCNNKEELKDNNTNVVEDNKFNISVDEEKAKTINTSISKDYKYFDISVEDFYIKIAYELKNNNIKVSELKSINYKDEYDLKWTSICDWNYMIELNNKDKVLLCNNNQNKISTIGYDFTGSLKNENARLFMELLSKLFLKDLDNDNFSNNIGKEFLENLDTYDIFTRNARYVYNHLLYGVDKNETKDEKDVFLFAFIKPEKALNNEEWRENSLKWLKEQEEKKLQEELEEKKNEPTFRQKNAIKKAEDYLDFMAFSKKGLIEQLEYEGFTKSEAKYAVENIDVDWNEQAVRKAKEYLDSQSFSKKKLISQLKYEGFTNAQAEYGAKQNGY